MCISVYYARVAVHSQYFLLAALITALLLFVAGYAYERSAERRDKYAKPAPGRMISVGERQLHLLCKGDQGPTVVIEQGGGEPARLWWAIQDRVAEFARVCTYDRAGYGWSDSAPLGRTIDQRVEDLHSLLINANLAPPFVFVAHSYGGLIVRWFAKQYPHMTAGLVLVDTPEEAVLFRPETLRFHLRMAKMVGIVKICAHFGILRLLAKRYSLDAVGLVFVRPHEYAAAMDDVASLNLVSAPLRMSAGFGALGNTPLAVLTHGQPFPGPFAILEHGWSDGQSRLAALSSAGELIVAKNSNHMINQDEPDLIVETIRRIHACARNRGIGTPSHA
jgi:pimeloyl-ACP methyl ester carboxylesterase